MFFLSWVVFDKKNNSCPNSVQSYLKKFKNLELKIKNLRTQSHVKTLKQTSSHPPTTDRSSVYC